MVPSQKRGAKGTYEEVAIESAHREGLFFTKSKEEIVFNIS